MLFATPDFGAGGLIVLVLLGIGLAVLLAAVALFIRGVILLNRPSARSRLIGWLLVVGGLALPVLCYVTPGVLFRLTHDTPPLEKYPTVVDKGMTTDQVRTLLGNPHEEYNQGREGVHWLYWLDPVGISWFMVRFGPGGRVEGTNGN